MKHATGINSGSTRVAVVLIATAFADIGLSQEDPTASRLTTIHTFKQGVSPAAIIQDQAGAIYGATSEGGFFNAGTVFQLTAPATPGGRWTETVLHSFGGVSDGSEPLGTGLVFDTQGRLYGTTYSGGRAYGTVFQLTPPTAPGAAWSETVIYSFLGGGDGANPESGLVFDPNGVLYGTTYNGGGTVCSGQGCGTVFALTPPVVEGEAWTEEVILRFPESGFDGYGPLGPLLLGMKGALYGMVSGRSTVNGGFIFQLQPPAVSGDVWRERVLQSFAPAINPEGLTFGKEGALYGTTSYGGSSGGGLVIALAPPFVEGGFWTETVLHEFGAAGDGAIPHAGVVFGKNGEIYGTTSAGGANGWGTIYRLRRPTVAGAAWSESVLYSFANTGDGAAPGSGLAISSSALYGVTDYQDSPDTIFQFIL